MNRFRFRLENVLRVRKAKEDEKKRDFGIAVGHLSQEEKQHKVILQAAEDHTRLRAEQNTGSISVRQQIQNYFYAQHLRSQGGMQEEKVQKAKEIVEEKRADMTTAMKDRKTLERLKEKQQEAFQHQSDLEEQAQIDETATQRFIRQRD